MYNVKMSSQCFCFLSHQIYLVSRQVHHFKRFVSSSVEIFKTIYLIVYELDRSNVVSKI